MKYLYLLQQAMIWIITVYWLYQLVVSFCSLIKLKDKPLLVDKKHKFMAVIPAHNEEAVVGNLVESLKAQDYPEDKFDIYVIADNCTDDTAKVAKQAGAIVLKRFDDTKRTKGYALNWFLQQKIAENADYDAFCVFDADNIVDKNFLKNMNKKLCQGEEVVQGYRDIKNPRDSWVASGYAIFYWMMHRFYHLARYNLGLSALLNGTGFMVKFDLVKPNGWQTITLTEDIEFSLMNIIEGRKVGWSTDAIVYDEQPLSFSQSWKQRSRWSVGHMQCMKHYLGSLTKGVAEHKNLMSFDGLLYMFGIPMMIITLMLLVVNTLLYTGGEMAITDLVWSFIKYGVSTFITPIIISMAIMKLDKRDVKSMWLGILMYPIFMGSWILINIKCLINPNTEWEKVEHVRDIKIREIA